MGQLLRNRLIINKPLTEIKGGFVNNRLKLLDVPKQTRVGSGVTAPNSELFTVTVK